MNVNLTTGLLSDVEYIPSPHCDERPQESTIDMIVVHGISLPPGEFGGNAIQDFFCGKLDNRQHPYFETIATLRVSSHLYIDRAGHVIQFVPFHRRAWHAGQSQFQGRDACNDFSIGIELEGTDDIPYEQVQYQRLVSVIQSLMRVYPAIMPNRIVGHADIAPGRKTDPGPAFDWNHLKHLLWMKDAVF